MPFIAHSGPKHPGGVLYVILKTGTKRGFDVAGYRDQAHRFPSRVEAKAVAGRFSSLYGMVTTEVKE